MTPQLLNAVIGKPLTHSLSPRLHNAIYKTYEIPAILLPFETEDLKAYFSAVRTLNIGLTAVTHPHKENVLPFLDEIEPIARDLGAVNTVIFKEGKLKGYNTDLIGIAQTLENWGLKDKRVLILGAGGVAHAMAHVLSNRGAKITMSARRIDQLQPFIQLYNVETLVWEQRVCFRGACIINTTPLGMFPYEEETPFPSESLQTGTLIFDVIYNPLKTRFLKESEQKGCTIMNGLSMFLAQAYEQIRLWKGFSPQLQALDFLTESL